jgi:hypothetical protein
MIMENISQLKEGQAQTLNSESILKAITNLYIKCRKCSSTLIYICNQ